MNGQQIEAEGTHQEEALRQARILAAHLENHRDLVNQGRVLFEWDNGDHCAAVEAFSRSLKRETERLLIRG